MRNERLSKIYVKSYGRQTSSRTLEVRNGGRRMKCTRCGTNVDREATDRGICFDCYCQLDMQDYEAHLQLREEE